MRRIITIAYTALDAGGGVPKFNRDIHEAFADRECLHFCWQDFPWWLEIDARGETEWAKARILNEYLVRSRKVTTDDVVIADGFWAAGLEHLPLAVSHSHGIWSHLTQLDVTAGKQPDMPYHHVAQVAFRRRWTDLKKHITAVSHFIAEQMKLQWGFAVDRVINNGVDTDVYKQYDLPMILNDLLIIHGVNDRANTNKGWDHIELIKQKIPSAHVLSLDDACMLLNERHGPLTKAQVLSQADLVVHPSGYEGNSMFVAETLASGVPIVGYDVGFAYWLQGILEWNDRVGSIISRMTRSPETTLSWVQKTLGDDLQLMGKNARRVAKDHLSMTQFNMAWRCYVEGIEDAA